MSKVRGWRALAGRILKRANDVFEGANVPLTEKGAKDPKVIALALLARTVNNFEAALKMIEAGYVVEARTLTRCCWENLFWSAALVKKGEEFVQRIELDDAFSRQKRGKRLLNWSKAQEAPRDFESTLEAFLEEFAERNPDRAGIQHAQAAEAGSVKGGYIIYGELSNDAAHPSASSLSRHVEWNDDDSNFTIHARAPVELDEVEQTLEFACSSMFGVLVAANQLFGYPINVDAEAKEFTALSNKSKS
jgi:hypothetical protein